MSPAVQSRLGSSRRPLRGAVGSVYPSRLTRRQPSGRGQWGGLDCPLRNRLRVLMTASSIVVPLPLHVFGPQVRVAVAGLTAASKVQRHPLRVVVSTNAWAAAVRCGREGLNR